MITISRHKYEAKVLRISPVSEGVWAVMLDIGMTYYMKEKPDYVVGQSAFITIEVPSGS